MASAGVYVLVAALAGLKQQLSQTELLLVPSAGDVDAGSWVDWASSRAFRKSNPQLGQKSSVGLIG